MSKFTVPEENGYFPAEREDHGPLYGGIPQAAKLTGLSRYTVRRLVEDGKIPALRIGSDARFAYRVDLTALQEYLRQEAQRNGPVQF